MIGSVPITGELVPFCTHVVLAKVAPAVTKTLSPMSISADWSKSVVLVSTNTAIPEPVAVTLYIPFWKDDAWFLIRTLSLTDGDELSKLIAASATPVSVAPTPLEPFAYTIEGNTPVEAYLHASFASVP